MSEQTRVFIVNYEEDISETCDHLKKEFKAYKHVDHCCPE